jgi:adenine C2-methylase RlmN of 23S rRNA A2503 and tRNA A37
MDRYLQFCQDHQLPSFRYRQILHGVYQQLVDDYSQITTLPEQIQQLLSAEMPLQQLQHLHTYQASDGTSKDVWKLAEGQIIVSAALFVPQVRWASKQI